MLRVTLAKARRRQEARKAYLEVLLAQQRETNTNIQRVKDEIEANEVKINRKARILGLGKKQQ